MTFNIFSFLGSNVQPLLPMQVAAVVESSCLISIPLFLS